MGAVLGFLTVWFMNRLWLTPEQNGLINILISISLISGSLVNLGMAGVATRLFPHLRNPENNHHGFLLKAMSVTSIGFILFALLYWSTRDALIARNAAKSALFAQHTELLLPLTFFIGAFYILDAYSRSLFLSTLGVVVKEVGLRVVILIAAMAYHWNVIDFETFVWIYCGSFCAMAMVMVFYLWQKGKLAWGTSSTPLKPELKREILWVAGFSVLTGLSSLLISSIDKIIVNDKLGLAAAGIFSVATYFGSIIQIPARSIVRIASGVIAESWKNKDTANILDIYKKTCLNQFILGSFLFIAICGNLEQLIGLLPHEYAEAKNVIFFIGLGYLIDMATGANGVIIGTSD
ncbi:MAG: lipopolysaccharide biosynthesis protein, partial [Flavobacteriales bacterium]